MSSPLPRRAALPLLVLLVLATACVEELPDDPVQIAVLQVGQETHSLAEFQDYLRSNLLADEDEVAMPEAERDAVMSRLYDAWVDEKLLLREARRRKIAVDDLEVEAYLSTTLEDDDMAIPAFRWQMARQRLTLAALEEAVAAELPPLSDAEVKERLEARLAEAGDDRRVRFRSVRFEKQEDADRAYRNIRRGRNTFDEILVTYALPPEQGVPVEMSWSDLSEPIREALDGLRRGRVSEPTPLDGGVYLFLVQSWIEGPPPVTPARLEAMRREQNAERRHEAYAELLRELRRAPDVEREVDNLPFRYVRDEEPTE